MDELYGGKESGTKPADPYDDKNTPIIVEFSSTSGDRITRETGIFDRFRRSDLVERSDKAIDKAMGIVQQMSQRVNAAIANIDKRPGHVQVEFGIKFDGEVGIVIAKASMEASMNVTLTWDL
jgi:Trypsin-co-occurring domain 1